jgi:lipase maturation factor
LAPRTPFARLRDQLFPGSTHVLTRFIILRLLGVVYLAAFLGLVRQLIPLIGREGLLPADSWLREVAATLGSGSRTRGFARFPSIFWLDASDGFLLACAWSGVALSALVIAGRANAAVMALLWGLYASFVHVGQVWYGYGWEIQLVETGFLAIFLVPLLDWRALAARPPPAVAVWLFRWLAFRIMLGAGLIKMRHDPCWRDLTCLDFHFETQPVPNPLSPFFHFLPHAVHAAGVVLNHLCELGCPFLILAGPRRLRHIAAGAMATFQLLLIVSGNLSFLNWLTLVAILACFDDDLLAGLLPRRLVARAAAARAAQPAPAHRVASWTVFGLVAFLSVDPVRNLMSPAQRMNWSYEPFDLVNTYGAFGDVGRERHELVIEGSSDGEAWLPYELPCKPGDPGRRPCVVSPYHHRLDWQIWFAAMTSPDGEPWVYHLIWKLLEGDRPVAGLFTENPFPRTPPRWIRVRRFRYRLAPPGDRAWWRRELEGEWLPPLSLDSPELRSVLVAYGWLREAP